MNASQESNSPQRLSHNNVRIETEVMNTEGNNVDEFESPSRKKTMKGIDSPRRVN